MNYNLKKFLPALALSLVALTSSANASQETQIRSLENRVNALEKQKGSNAVITPPESPVVKNGFNLWTQAEALYMHATEDGMDYAIQNNNAVTYPDGRIKNSTYNWDWGFRVGAGYNLPHDGWDLFLNWTWFRSHKNHTLSAESDQYLFGTRSVASDTQGNFHATSANAHQTLHVNVVDLEMGREFFVSKWLALRPFVGVRGAWFRQKFDVKYSGGSTLSTSTLEDEFHDRYNAGGLRSGFDSQWGLGSGWSIFGQLAASLLYGKHRLHGEEELTTIAGVETEQENVQNHWTMVRAMTDLALGFRWDHLFYNDRYRIRFQLGWEEHIFFGFNRDIDFVDDTVRGKLTSNRGDLAISGVSFQARFDF